MGRKSKWETHIKPKLELIKSWYGNDIKEKDICKKLMVGVSTWEKYKSEYPELKEALEDAREDRTYKVEEALISNAKGGWLISEKAIKLKDTLFSEDTGKPYKSIERIEIVEVKHQVRGDTTAQIFYLKNHWSDMYKDRVTQVDTSKEDKLGDYLTKLKEIAVKGK